MLRIVCASFITASLLAVGAAQAQESGQRNLLIQKVPPPRITDVVELVRRTTVDRTELEKKLRLLEQEPPEASRWNNNRRDFLVERAEVADELGQLSRRMADLKEAADLSRGASDEYNYVYNYGLAQALSGDVSLGIEALQRVLELLRTSQGTGWGLLSNSYALLAYAYADMGQLDKAEEHIKQSQALMVRLRQNPGGAWARVPAWEMMLLMGEGRILLARGKWAEAEAVMRRRLALGGAGEGGRLDADRLVRMAFNKIHLANILLGINLGYADLARQLMRQGQFDEAELMLRDLLAVNLRGSGRYSLRTAMTLTQLADLLAARGRLADASQILAEVDDIARTMGVGRTNQLSIMLARTRLNLQVLRQDWPATAAAEAAYRDVLASGSVFRLGLITPGVGIGWVRTGRAAEAVPRLRLALQESTQVLGVEHEDVAQLRGVLAMALAALGQRADARAEYAAASARLLDQGGHEAEAQALSMQGLLRRLILEAYLDFLADEPAGGGAAAQAFRVADALHQGKTQQALAQSAARSAARQADLAELVRKEQDGRTEQQMLYGQLLHLASMPADQQLPQVMAAMRLRIASIDRERREAQVTLERRFPAYANLVRPKSPTLDEARAVLKGDEALINILSTEAATYVWALRREGQVAFVRVPLTREALQRMVQGLRKAVDPGAIDIARSLPAFDLETAHRLYQTLLQPVAPAWRGAGSLLVVSNGALGQLPLALLPTAPVTLAADGGPRYANYQQVPWLLREAAFTQLPSVNALVTLRRLPDANAQRQPFIGFGDPDFGGPAVAQAAQRGLRNLAVVRFNGTQDASSSQSTATPAPTQPANAVPAAAAVPDWMPYSDIPPLPDTREEVLSLAQVLKADPQRAVFLGREASKERVLKADLARSRVVAFATHGLLPGEFPGVNQPSLALANPGNGQHGLLTLEDILGLKLDADWVVLSACNTAAGDGTGAEAVSGLGRGFFYAGTRALLATHWPVESASARLLVTGTFANQAADPGLSRAQALRKSMLALMDQKSDAGFSYAHPLFWAPYALIGDGGL